MKNFKRNIFFLTLTVFTFFSCVKKDETVFFNEEYQLLDSLCKNNYAKLSNTGKDSAKISFNQYVLKMRSKAENLLNSLENDTFSNDSLINFQKITYKLIKYYEDVSMASIDEEMNDNKAFIKYKIKQLEYLVSNIYVRNMFRARFDFDHIQTMVIPEKKVIKLGEEYQAKVCFIAKNSSVGYIVVVNGDTVRSIDKDVLDGVPVYKVKPTKIGDYVTDGNILVEMDGKEHKYPFRMEYQVK